MKVVEKSFWIENDMLWESKVPFVVEDGKLKVVETPGQANMWPSKNIYWYREKYEDGTSQVFEITKEKFIKLIGKTKLRQL